MSGKNQRQSRGGYVPGASWRFLIEWFLIAIVAVALLLVFGLGDMTERLDWTVYDLSLARISNQSRKDIIVVSIDDRSLKELGRWPWPRSAHAALLNVLARASARAVLYDVIFTEPTPEDGKLAEAMHLIPTYVPFIMAHGTGEHPTVVMPVPVIRDASAGLGFINMEPDRDGILRSVGLIARAQDHLWPQFVVPVYMRERKKSEIRNVGCEPDRLTVAARRYVSKGLDCPTRMLIPFSRELYRVPVISFSSVLHGEVPPEFLRDKIVFVGATALGLGDHLATPNADANGETPGVFIHVSVLAALLNQSGIQPSSKVGVVLLSLIPVCALLAGLLIFTPARALAWLIGLLVVTWVTSESLLIFDHLWVSPVPTVIVLLFTYFLWSWRRLALAMSWLVEELEQLAREPHVFPDSKRGPETRGDVLARYITSVRHLAKRQREMRRFVLNTLNSLPHPVLVADRGTHVLFFNTAAHSQLYRAGSAGGAAGFQLITVLGTLTFVRSVATKEDGEADITWPDVLDCRVAANAWIMTRGVEVQDSEGRHYFLRYAFAQGIEGSPDVWIATLVDITQMLFAQRQRDELLSFLSHDMRSPLGSILALLTASRDQGASTLDESMIQQIEHYTNRTLDLADNFVRLAHAESQTYAFQTINFGEIALDACDEVWVLAQEKKINVSCRLHEEDSCWVVADGSLMKRALLNLLSNAVKYSQAGSAVECHVRPGADEVDSVQCIIQDHGFGIEPRYLPHLFERFRRFRARGQPAVDGVGLGLVFVKTVIERHRGKIAVQSEPGAGTIVTITLPSAAEYVSQTSSQVAVRDGSYVQQ